MTDRAPQALLQASAPSEPAKHAELGALVDIVAETAEWIAADLLDRAGREPGLAAGYRRAAVAIRDRAQAQRRRRRLGWALAG